MDTWDFECGQALGKAWNLVDCVGSKYYPKATFAVAIIINWWPIFVTLCTAFRWELGGVLDLHSRPSLPFWQ